MSVIFIDRSKSDSGLRMGFHKSKSHGVLGVRGHLEGSVSDFPAVTEVLPEVLPTVKISLHHSLRLDLFFVTAVSPG